MTFDTQKSLSYYFQFVYNILSMKRAKVLTLLTRKVVPLNSVCLLSQLQSQCCQKNFEKSLLTFLERMLNNSHRVRLQNISPGFLYLILAFFQKF